MQRVRNILRKYWIAILWVTLGFGAAGSLLGASVESRIRSDIHHSIPRIGEAGTTLPYMAGWFDLSKDQNLWYNFSYALRWAVLGFACSIFLLMIITILNKRIIHKTK